MKPGDFLFYTLDGDAANPPTTYIGEITAFDPGANAVQFTEINSGEGFQFQIPVDVTGPWDVQNGQGATVTLATHDVYTAGAASPTPQGIALVTFADLQHYLCTVDSVSPTTDVVFFQQPQHRMSFDNDAITQSDWDTYPVGDQIRSIEAYVLDTSLTQPPAAPPPFANGWWAHATQHPAFAGRIGGAIQPFAVVVHTTDMVPEDWQALVDGWTNNLGDGACAHFLIGRDANAGVLQLTQITNNGNHAGGDGHGWFVDPGGQQWHPNSVSVGIEVHCAGGVQQIDNQWRFLEKGVVHGDPLPDDDVIPDPQRPGRGWHKVTDYQYQQLGQLLDDLETVLNALPAGCVAQSVVEQTPAWGTFPTGRRVGHVSLDTYNRSDPWPPTCDWMRAR